MSRASEYISYLVITVSRSLEISFTYRTLEVLNVGSLLAPSYIAHSNNALNEQNVVFKDQAELSYA